VTRSATGGQAKPAIADLGIDPAELDWERSGDGDGSIEVAFPAGPRRGRWGRWVRGDWVLLRVAGDPAGRVLVFDRNEWECFLDGVRNGEFDDASEEPVKPVAPAGPDETEKSAE